MNRMGLIDYLAATLLIALLFLVFHPAKIHQFINNLEAQQYDGASSRF